MNEKQMFSTKFCQNNFINPLINHNMKLVLFQGPRMDK